MLKANGVTARPAAHKDSNGETTPKSSPAKRKAGDAKSKKTTTKKVKAEPDSPPRGRRRTPVKSESNDEDEDDDQTVISGKYPRLHALTIMFAWGRLLLLVLLDTFRTMRLTFSLAAQTLLSLTATMRPNSGRCDGSPPPRPTRCSRDGDSFLAMAI